MGRHPVARPRDGRLNLRLPAEDLDEVRRRSAALGTTVSDFIRRRIACPEECVGRGSVDPPRTPPSECRIILISGIAGGIGRSLIAGNLAAALAEQGDRTLLVDFDRWSDASRWFGLHTGRVPDRRRVDPKRAVRATTPIPDEQTLYGRLLSDPERGVDDPASLVRPTDEGVDVLPTGSVLAYRPLSMHDPSLGLLDLVARSLPSLREAYRFIVVDSPDRTEDAALAAARHVGDVVLFLANSTERGTGWLPATLGAIRSRPGEPAGCFAFEHGQKARRKKRALSRTLQLLGIPALEAKVGDRAAFQSAQIHDRSVIDCYPRSEAAREIRTLARALKEELAAMDPYTYDASDLELLRMLRGGTPGAQFVPARAAPIAL